MRHLNAGRKLNRTGAHRLALMRNLVLSLIQHGRITTTDAKAKELRGFADHMITLGKQGDLAARRQAYDFIRSHAVVKVLFDEVAPRFQDRPGGYTRVIKFQRRRGDAAEMSVIELTGTSETATRKPRKRSARKQAAAEE